MLAFAASDTATFINFVVGLAGLVTGIGGFWLTLTQLAKVKRVSEAQEEAIASLKFRLAGFNAIQECAQAQLHLEAVRDAIQKSDKASALAGYDRLALSIINLSESGYVSCEISDDLRSGAERIAILAKGLDQSDISKVSIAKQLETSRLFHALLMRVRFFINKDQ